MRTAREKIIEGNFSDWKKEIINRISINNKIKTEE
jgi:hypothetical protein